MTAEQERAADPGLSAWVAASAGTGKTHVLTNRVLRLLLSGARPGGVLCLTFTKAAAAEMANRINSELAKWTTLPDEGLFVKLQGLIGTDPTSAECLAARRLFAQVLEVPGGLKIQTIHAFCQSLMGRFPLEAGVAPHATIMDERSAQELQQEATNRVLSDAARGQDNELEKALGLISASTTDIKLPDLVRDLMTRRRQLAQTDADSIAALMGTPEIETTGSILGAACEEDGIGDEDLQSVADALSTGTKAEKQKSGRIIDWLAGTAERRAAMIEDLMGVFLKASAKPAPYSEPLKSVLNKKTAESHPNAVTAAERVTAMLIDLNTRLRAARVAASSKALALFGKAINATYQQLKHQRAVLDYDDLILAARDLVASPDSAAWVLYKLDEGLEHILVDEAQDTNPDQWTVIEALASEFFTGLGTHEEARTVFAVGDAKQSIYSFQRADPAEFERTRQAFRRRVNAAKQQFHDGLLDISFRSTEAVLTLVDAVFVEETARNGMIFSDQERKIRHQAHRAGVAGLVELWPPELPETVERPDGWEPPVKRQEITDPDIRLARKISRQITHWLDTGEMLTAKGRPIRPDDIMILVRRRNDFFTAMVRELKRHNVPVAGVDRMILTEQLAVMDLLALGKFVLMPEDDLTLATVLKSPLVGLDDDQLFTLAYQREGSLWQSLKTNGRNDPTITKAHQFLANCLDIADRVPPFEFLSSVLDGGRRKAMLARLGPDALDPMDELLALAMDFERTHAPSLQGFIHWIEAAETEVKREMEQSRGEVRVMTVHGAKGLQAPIVFLPDTCGAPTQPPDVYWAEGQDGTPTMIWPVSSANRVGAAADAHEKSVALRDQEYNRQLYVALTRAADQLYICGYETQRGRPDHCWYNLIEAAFERLEAMEAADAEGTPVLRYATGTLSDGDKGTTAEFAAPPVAPSWISEPAPAEPLPSRPLAPSRPVLPDVPVRSPLAPDNRTRFLRGNLVHRLLQFLPDIPPEQRAEAASTYLSQPSYKLDEATRREWGSEVLNILVDPDFSPLFSESSAAEVPVTGLIGKEAVSGQIDRLAVTDDTVLIIDYKTNRPPPKRAEGVPALYRRQMAAYRALIEQVYPGRSVRCALLWTDGPVLMELPPEMLDEQLALLTAA